MRKILMVAAVAFCLPWLTAVPAAVAATHRFGAGANYWKTISNLDLEDVKNIDESGLSWLASYQYVPAGIFKLEVDLEYYPRLGEEPKAMWSPEAFLLVGGTLYAGAGIGVYYNGDIFSNKPFYMLRAGLDFAILPFLSLDINANYRFNDWNSLETNSIDTDTIRLGAALRFAM
jgi:opacity protein-like surface antigen